MINLKKLLLEGISPQSKLTEPFTLSDSDAWEYYVDEKTEIAYTRRKGTTKWLDMQSELSPDNYKKAIDKIHKGPIWPIKSNNIKKDIKKDTEDKKVINKKPDTGITRDKLGYITSNKASVYGKSFINASNKSVTLYPNININYIDRKTGKPEPGFYLGVIPSITPDEAYLYTIGSIKTVTMPTERGISGTPDPFNGRKFTYLYVTSGNDKFKGWIQSNLVKIDS